jgi:AAA15 family ATPase/GTPase
MPSCPTVMTRPARAFRRSPFQTLVYFAFTTQDTTLLDTNLLRRDQVWFVEKDAKQSTNLYPLLDYRPRKDEALERGYMKGRYGAVPMVGKLNG